MPQSAPLKILSHKNVCALTHDDRNKFLNLFFEELRYFMTAKIQEYSFLGAIFANNQSLLNQSKFFFVALSHCRATDRSYPVKKPYAEVESYLFIIYDALYEWIHKITCLKHQLFIHNIFHRLHLVVENIYSNHIKPIKISLPKKDIEANVKAFASLQNLVKDPAKTISNDEEKCFIQEMRSLSYLYQSSTFSNQDTNEFRKDVFSLTQKYPDLDHENILDEFSKKIQFYKY